MLFWKGPVPCLLLVTSLLLAGCTRSSGPGSGAGSGTGGSASTDGGAAAESGMDSESGAGAEGGTAGESGSGTAAGPASVDGADEVLLEPFDPPSLSELDAKAEWVDRPVVDSLAKLRAWKTEHDPPLVTVEQALAMRNNSPEDNTKILSALSQLAPADGAGVDFDETMSRALAQDLSSTNPLLISSVAENEINSLTGFGLFSFDWKMVPHAVSDVVVSWQTSQDRLMDKVVIRDDLVWSDGTPITAHDVVFSFQTIMNPNVPVPSVRQGTDKLRWVEAYDDHTLVYFQKQANATNEWNLNFPVIPRHIYEKSVADDPTLTTSAYHAQQEEKPVTGGSYEILRRIRGQEIVLRRRESWYMKDGEKVRDQPYFREMRFRILEDVNTQLLALKAGEIEETELGAEQWQTQTSGDDFYANNTKVTALEWTFFYIGYNTNTPYFGDKRVRQAMSLAMNHEEMLEDLCFGLYRPCFGIFHPDSWMFPKSPSAAVDRFNHQDLDKAEALLDEAGWVDSDGDGIRDKEFRGRRIPFEFTLLVSSKPDRIAICNLFRENLDTIGVVCNVQPLEAAVMQQRVFEKNFQAQMAGWGAGADPYTNENIFGTGKERNYGAYTNPEVDALFQQGMKEFDREKRAQIYARIHELVYEDQPYTFLYSRSSFYGFNKKLRGYNFSPRGPFHFGPGIGAIWAP